MKALRGLTSNKEFSNVFNHGGSVADRLLVVYSLPNGKPYTRFGLSVGKKVGKAVTRNRFKRILREICRSNLPIIKEGYDCVIIARPRILGENYRNIEKSFIKVAGKARLLGRELNTGEKTNCKNN
ncbi:MAG: ribonuclease P protein component [Eubacteriales bacterium]